MTARQAFDGQRLRRDIARIVLGPWPLRPWLTFIVVFLMYVYAHNAALDTFREPVREIVVALPLAALVGGSTAAIVFLGRRVERWSKGTSPRAVYLVTMLTAGAVLGLASHLARGLESPLNLDWRGWLFIVVRGLIGVFTIHAVAGVSEARLRAEVRRTEQALESLAEQRRVIVDAEERARGSVARFLHDNVQAGLVAISLQLRGIRERAPSPMDSQLGSIIEALEEMRAVDVRSASRRLSPDFASIGLRQALDESLATYAGSMNAEVRIDDALREWSHPTRHGHRQSLAAYRIIEQAVLNAAVHGHARNVWIDISRDGDTVTVSVADDGAGIQTQSPRRGRGLTIVDAWADIVQGAWTLRSRLPQGTVLEVTFPITKALAAHG